MHLQVTEKLVEEKVVVPFELEMIKVQHDSTVKKIKEYQRSSNRPGGIRPRPNTAR